MRLEFGHRSCAAEAERRIRARTGGLQQFDDGRMTRQPGAFARIRAAEVFRPDTEHDRLFDPVSKIRAPARGQRERGSIVEA